MRLASTVSSLVIAAALLTGCTATVSPSTAESPSPSASPRPTEEPAETRPTPRFPLECASITGIDTLAAVIGSIAPQSSLALHAAFSPRISRLTYVEAAGGLVCEWSNGAVHSATNTPSGWLGVTVEVLPDAAEAWARFASQYNVSGDRSAHCNPSIGTTSNCGLDELVGDYWVHSEISGLNFLVAESSTDSAIPEAAEFFASLASQLSALGASGPAWEPPAGTRALPSECDAIMPASEVEQTLGFSSTVYAEGPHGGWSQWADARTTLGGSCFWYDGNTSVGSIDWLSYGAWAAEELRALSTLPSAPERVDVPGLGADDSAYLRCDTDGVLCVVDLVVSGSWVQFDVRDPAPAQTIAVSPRDGALAIAASIVARLTA
jgi:hypothetical protein